MSCRNRHEVNDSNTDLSNEVGVVKEASATIDGADHQEFVGSQSVEVKSRDVDLIAAEISTIDAISAGVKVSGVNGVEELSDTTSVSDDTPPSTPSSGSRGSEGRKRSRRRKLNVQDSHVSSSSSPARGPFSWPDLATVFIYKMLNKLTVK